MNKAIVLSSGGVDSTTALALAVNQFGKDNVLSLSFFYGQKHDKELKAAANVALVLIELTLLKLMDLKILL